MDFMNILIFLSLATPVVLIFYGLWKLLMWWTERTVPIESVSQPYSHVVDPTYKTQETTITTAGSGVPLWVGIDEESFLRDDDEEEDESVEAGMRVWRIYRTIDRTTWAECDPALTERAACNYANYIKKSNPNEFVRCDNPDGMILFYE